MSQLFRRKPIAALMANDPEHSLRRVLGAGDLVMLAIGAVIRYGAGSALVFSFLLLGSAYGYRHSCVRDV